MMLRSVVDLQLGHRRLRLMANWTLDAREATHLHKYRTHHAAKQFSHNTHLNCYSEVSNLNLELFTWGNVGEGAASIFDFRTLSPAINRVEKLA